MYEKHFVEDGEPAFGVEGTFQIHNTVYIVDDEADFHLLNRLGDLGYKISHSQGAGYIASLTHRQTQDEIFEDAFNAPSRGVQNASSLVVSTEYLGEQRFSLKHPFVHNHIIRAASYRSDIGYYDRPHDQMDDVALSRMSAFVKNMVEVDFELWEDFVSETRQYHAQDFIRRLAHWASQHSDRVPREVKVDTHGSVQIISGADQFNLTKPLPISGLRGGPFFRR